MNLDAGVDHAQSKKNAINKQFSLKICIIFSGIDDFQI